MSLISDSLFIIASFVFVLIWKETNLENITGTIIGLLTLLYVLTNLPKIKRKIFRQKTWEKISTFLLQTVVFILISTTGGINSTLFPLLYFVSFAIAFEYEPSMVFVFMGTLLLFFFPDMRQNNGTENIIKLGVVFLLSPLAYFFGREFRLRIKQERHKLEVENRTNIATEQITDDVVSLVQEKGQEIKQNDLERLNDILTQIHELQRQTVENEKYE